MGEENFSAIVERLYAELGWAPDEITRALLDELGISSHAADVLYSPVRDRVAHNIRQTARRLVDQNIIPPGPPSPRESKSRRVVRQRVRPYTGDPRLRFLECMVPCPGAPGGAKAYGDFTAEELRSRMERIHKPNLKAAKRHISEDEWALDQIAAHKVTCLRDIPADALLEKLGKREIRP